MQQYFLYLAILFIQYNSIDVQVIIVENVTPTSKHFEHVVFAGPRQAWRQATHAGV